MVVAMDIDCRAEGGRRMVEVEHNLQRRWDNVAAVALDNRMDREEDRENTVGTHRRNNPVGLVAVVHAREPGMCDFQAAYSWGVAYQVNEVAAETLLLPW